MRFIAYFHCLDRGRRWSRVAARLSTLLVALWVASSAFGAQAGLVELPLAERSQPTGATMFTLMPPEQTGIKIENRYDDPKMWAERYQEFAFGVIGTGIAIGDYDGDGRPDVFIVSKTGRSRLFRNLGGWRFEDVTEKAGLQGQAGSLDRGLAWAGGLLGHNEETPDDKIWKQGAAFVDVNNDGRLDLYVCRFNAPNLLYINQGNGTFKEEAAARGVAVSDASGMAAFCDYDRDGWLDFYLVTNLLDSDHAPAGQRDRLFHNRGDGTFEEVTDRAGISGEAQGHAATWWDYDEDGWPDLYVTNDFAAPDKLYHNNRDGTFTDVIDRVAPHTPFSSMSSDLGDINNDGRLDFFVTDMAATTPEKDQRAMADARAQRREPPLDSSQTPQVLRNALFLNEGGGVLREGALLMGLGATDWTWSVRFEDLDNDGRVDLHVTNGMVREAHGTDLLNAMMRAESLTERARLMRTSPVLAEHNLAFRNLGDLHFENVGARWGLDELGVSFGAAFGDLDGDGDLDLIYANFEHGPTVLRNDCVSGHRCLFDLHGTRSNRFGVGATVTIQSASGRQVRCLTLARGYLSTSEPMLHFGLGDDTKINHVTVQWPSGLTQEFADLAVDRRYVITEPDRPAEVQRVATKSETTPFVEVSTAIGFSVTARETPIEETAAQPLLPERFNRRGPALAIGDLNGDGVDDVVMGGTVQDTARILIGHASGHFDAPVALTTGVESALNDGPILIFDADGDGRPDVLVTKGGAALPAEAAQYQPTLFFNREMGGFQPAAAGVLPVLPISVGAAAVADFNHDGKLDIFIGGRVEPGRYPLTPRSALLANRGGRFEDVTDELAPGLAQVGMVTSCLWTDVDQDGWIDLVVTTEWGGVDYWRNEQGHLVNHSTEAGFTTAGTGWWNSIEAADFNGDGRLDYAIGNVGLNTPYRASPEAPALLFYGSFGTSGPPQIIEARYDGDRLVPWRTRKELGARFPAMARKFPQSAAYARASLADLFGEANLAAAQRFAATEFRSGVLLSQPDGTFKFSPLPQIAQIAPFQGLVAGDFDGDGRADLFAVQNSHAPVSSVGWFDGGLGQLLLGDGRGGFTPVGPMESGLTVPGDAKALGVVDLGGDGWPDFLVTRNHATTLAFKNQGGADRHMVRVVLVGKIGNPTAIGARLTAEHADGTKQTAEIHAGGGYWSQSGAAAYFGWTSANPLRHLRIEWPDGETTTREMTERSGTLRIER